MQSERLSLPRVIFGRCYFRLIILPSVFFSRCYFCLVILACVILALVLYSPHMQTISLCLKFPQTWSPYVQMYIYIKKSLPANDTDDWGKNKTRVNISLYTVSVVALGFIKAISTHYSHPSSTHTVKPLKWWLLLKINHDNLETVDVLMNDKPWYLGNWVKFVTSLSLSGLL